MINKLLTRNTAIFLCILIFISVVLFYQFGRSIWVPAYKELVGKDTVETVIAKYGANAENRLQPYFKKANVDYPPKSIKLLAIKSDDIVELWAKTTNNDYKKIREYQVQAASGIAGPKLREGDKQVPEGIYKIIGLNPNSSYHLSMKLNYPNSFDLKHAQAEGRTRPGSNIFIHGKAVSIGCLAMGDTAIEELFTLVYKVGTANTQVIIAPYDPRKKPLIMPEGTTHYWIKDLYKAISKEFLKYV